MPQRPHRLFQRVPRVTSDLWPLTRADLCHVARIKLIPDFLFRSIRRDARIRPFVDGAA